MDVSSIQASGVPGGGNGCANDCREVSAAPRLRGLLLLLRLLAAGGDGAIGRLVPAVAGRRGKTDCEPDWADWKRGESTSSPYFDPAIVKPPASVVAVIMRDVVPTPFRGGTFRTCCKSKLRQQPRNQQPQPQQSASNPTRSWSLALH